MSSAQARWPVPSHEEEHGHPSGLPGAHLPQTGAFPVPAPPVPTVPLCTLASPPLAGELLCGCGATPLPHIRDSTSLGSGLAQVPLSVLSGPSLRGQRGEARSQGKFRSVQRTAALSPVLERAQLTPRPPAGSEGGGCWELRVLARPHQRARRPRGHVDHCSCSGLGFLGLPLHFMSTGPAHPDAAPGHHRPAGRPGL